MWTCRIQFSKLSISISYFGKQGLNTDPIFIHKRIRNRIIVKFGLLHIYIKIRKSVSSVFSDFAHCDDQKVGWPQLRVLLCITWNTNSWNTMQFFARMQILLTGHTVEPVYDGNTLYRRSLYLMNPSKLSQQILFYAGYCFVGQIAFLYSCLPSYSEQLIVAGSSSKMKDFCTINKIYESCSMIIYFEMNIGNCPITFKF